MCEQKRVYVMRAADMMEIERQRERRIDLIKEMCFLCQWSILEYCTDEYFCLPELADVDVRNVHKFTESVTRLGLNLV